MPVSGFDLQAFAREWGERVSNAPAADEDEPGSGVFLRYATLASVPRLAVSQHALMGLALDHRAGFVLSFVDGKYDVEALLDVAGMSRHEVLAILGELAVRGIIVIE